jgi:hypothetical protein
MAEIKCPWCKEMVRSEDAGLVITKAGLYLLVCEKCFKKAK